MRLLRGDISEVRLDGKKVFVAGGSGLLGTHLTERLLAVGADVTASCFNRPPPEHLAASFRRYDFCKFEDCLAATRCQDYVLICAVQASGVAGMSKSATATVLPNLAIHAGLFEACAQNDVKGAVWVSSSTVYQEAEHPVREGELDLNLPTYALYQGIGGVYRYLEQLARCYRDKGLLNIGVVRTSSIYGPYDRFDDEKSHVIPALMKRALAQEDPFVVWGDGNTVRDFVYVEDLVAGALRVLEDDCISEPVNFSHGAPVTIAELAETVLRICDHRVDVHYDASKPAAVPYRVLDNSEFDRRYGVTDRTSLEEGLKRTLYWYQSERSRE